MCPRHIELSCAPGTFKCSHWCSPCEQSSQKLKICFHGVSEATSLSRHQSPLGMGLPSWKVWPPAIVPPRNTLDHWNTLLLMSSDGKWTESPPSSTGTVCIHSLQWYCTQTESLHCAACLKSGNLAPGKCHTFLCCSQ